MSHFSFGERGGLICTKATAGRVFDPRQNGHFGPLFSHSPSFFSHSGNRSYIFHPNRLMIPHFPPLPPPFSPISQKFPFFAPVCQTPKSQPGELVSSVVQIPATLTLR